MGVGDDEADVRGDGADVGGVVVDAFQFEQDDPREARMRRSFHAGRALQSQAIRETVAETRVSGNALCKKNAMVQRHGFKAFFDAFMCVKQA